MINVNCKLMNYVYFIIGIILLLLVIIFGNKILELIIFYKFNKC